MLAQPAAPSGFYTKQLMYEGIPIWAHAVVSDEALVAARNNLARLVEHAPALRENLEAAHLEFHVIGKTQLTSDLPEHRSGRGTKLPTGEMFDGHMRGGHIEGRFASCTEGSLLQFVGDIHFGTETCLHELAHAVEWLALSPAVRVRIFEQYGRSIAAGHWAKQYAAKDHSEYFAELTRYYFTVDGRNEVVDPRLGHGRKWLEGEDPEGFHLVDDLYSGRLAPGAAPHIAVKPQPGSAEPTLRSIEGKIPSTLQITNRTSAPFRVLWIDYEGHRFMRTPLEEKRLVMPGGEQTVYTYATHVFVVVGADESAQCAVVAPPDYAEAVIEGACK